MLVIAGVLATAFLFGQEEASPFNRSARYALS
jgi:hypothetical protein